MFHVCRSAMLCPNVQFTVMVVREKWQGKRPDKGRRDRVRASGLRGQVRCVGGDKHCAGKERRQSSGSGLYSI